MRLGHKPVGRVDLDETDKRIVALLQEEGRRPAAEIARLVGTSVQTVSKRIARLYRGAVIDVMAILNPAAIGFEKDALVCLRVRQGCLKDVGERLAEMECVSYVGYLAGSFDIMIEVYVHDDEHLFRFLTEELSQIEGIEATETWTVLHTQKYNYAWANPFNSSGTSETAAPTATG